VRYRGESFDLKECKKPDSNGIRYTPNNDRKITIENLRDSARIKRQASDPFTSDQEEFIQVLVSNRQGTPGRTSASPSPERPIHMRQEYTDAGSQNYADLAQQSQKKNASEVHINQERGPNRESGNESTEMAKSPGKTSNTLDMGRESN